MVTMVEFKKFSKIIRMSLKRIRSFSFKLIQLLSKFLKKHKEDLLDLVSLLIIVLIYGFMLNISFHYLFGFKIGVGQIIGFGIAFYLIKEELPHIIRNCFPKE